MLLNPSSELEGLVPSIIEEALETIKKEEISEEALYYELLRKWKKGLVKFNKQQKIMFKVILKGREREIKYNKHRYNQVICEALYIVFYATDYENFEEELKWWL